MIVQDQTAITDFLGAPETYGISGKVVRIETHISEVFLAGSRAYKLKRAVKLPYADFSTPELRLHFCEREVELNRRTAPDLYMGVRRITNGKDGRLAFDGGGELVDAVVEMVRFSEDTIFDRMAEKGGLSARLMRDLADRIVDFHAAAETVPDASGSALMQEVLAINEAGFGTSDVFLPGEIRHLCDAFQFAFDRHRARLDERSREGRVCHGHGDLHLRNICMFEGDPILFDCIEFNDNIATVDVLYDLAFLLMDLWHRGLPEMANLVANRYVDRTGNEDGWSLLPFFMAVRAAVRAHVTATQVAEAEGGDEAAAALARQYYRLAESLLAEDRPRLLAIGGMSGTGKSTLAEKIAPQLGLPPGARILESDRTRKQLFGHLPEEALPLEGYSAEVSGQVYHSICERAAQLLRDGSAVVANAVFSDRQWRQKICNAASGSSAPFTGIWLEAPAEVLRERVANRSGTASDADIGVLEGQLASISNPEDWEIVQATGSVEDTAGQIIAVLAKAGG